MGSIIALITARGGSKGLPRKNILPLAGKPLIAWSIEAALASPGVERVIVSTDDEEIARVSREWGAEVPFMRPAELASDTASHVDVVEHAIRWLEASGKSELEYLLLLQPTSPLRTAADIEGIIELVTGSNPPAAISVYEVTDHPYYALRLLGNGTLSDFLPGQPGQAYPRRQDLPPAYITNGALYIVRPDMFLKERTFTPPGTLAFIMPAQRSLDIDTEWDFYLANLILTDKNKHADELH